MPLSSKLLINCTERAKMTKVGSFFNLFLRGRAFKIQIWSQKSTFYSVYSFTLDRGRKRNFSKVLAKRITTLHCIRIWNRDGQKFILPTLGNRVCVQCSLRLIVLVIWKRFANRRKATPNIHNVPSNMNNLKAAPARIYAVSRNISQTLFAQVFVKKVHMFWYDMKTLIRYSQPDLKTPWKTA